MSIDTGKRILLFGNHPPPFGGVPAHIQYLAPCLASHGWDVHVLSIEGNSTWGFGSIEKLDGYTIHRPSKQLRWTNLLLPPTIPRETRNLIKYAGTAVLAKYVRQLVTRYDIRLISAYHIFSAGLASAMICREFEIPLITTVFGEIYSQQEIYSKHLNDVKYVIETSRKLLSCSKHCARSFVEIGLNPEVETVYYGIDTKLFNPDNPQDTIREQLGICNKSKVVIFVARMVKEMGLHVLLDAIPCVLAQDSAASFIIVGRSGELLPSANEVASRYPNNVFVVPDAPLEKLPLYYATATFAVIPSINARACLGLAIAEAMATAKPVIVSEIGGGPEVVVDGESGYLVPANDSKALAEQIKRMLSLDEGAVLEMGRLGRKRAVAVFDKDATNRRMEKIFREALI